LHTKHVNLPPPDYLAEKIESTGRFYPWFKDCIGALDGTHVPVFIRTLSQPAYTNRKGGFSQNVMGVCTFDLQFSYVYAGWEGSANDQHVLNDAIGKGHFQVPAGKYYLGDAGYVCSDFILSPYRGYRYHLKESLTAKAKPACKEELFNLRHAQLRNEVERIFGVLKRRFPILEKAYETLDMKKQVHLVYALTGLHNFIRQHATTPDLFDTEGMEKGEEEARANAETSIRTTIPSIEQRNRMETWRDQMAVEMWQDYLEYTAQA
jgi:hypothetical protein